MQFPDYDGRDLSIAMLQQCFHWQVSKTSANRLADKHDSLSCRLSLHKELMNRLQHMDQEVVTAEPAGEIEINVKTFNRLVIQGPNHSTIPRWKRKKSLEIVWFEAGEKTFECFALRA